MLGDGPPYEAGIASLSGRAGRTLKGEGSVLAGPLFLGRRVANKSQLQKQNTGYRSVGKKIHQSGETVIVYICLCNALTDRQVKLAAATAGTIKPSSVYAACGCSAQCGQCVKALVALLRGDDCAMPEATGAD
jgi:bacterioferritin-associated ferredoxin